MKKIAIITHTDFINRKGEANAALNRIKHLKQVADYDIDVYNLYFYDGPLVRLLRKTKKVKKIETINIDGVEIKYLWERFPLIDYVLEKKIGIKATFENFRYNKIIEKIGRYDAVSAHSNESGKLAMKIKERYGTPYFVTWHGSDIHTKPYKNSHLLKETVKILENATYNFFVSNALLKASEYLTTMTKKQLLYNGVNSEFHRYDDEKRKSLREKYDVNGKKVVAFVGGIVAIKNTLLLPEIFNSVRKKSHDKDLCFWIIGDGKQRQQLEQAIKEHKTECVLWGDQKTEMMPEFMNVIDVLILPSKNEGLPLVTVEALSCGANVVGSNVGGISEAIGRDNTFDLDDNFIENISNRIVEMLNNMIEQELSDRFNWKKTAEIENKFYQKELDNI